MQVMRTLIASLLFTVSAFAHPSVSVVIDSHGNVFYSDLKQIWRVAPDGSRSVAVPNVHSHALYIDAGDTLYGDVAASADREIKRVAPAGRLEVVARSTFPWSPSGGLIAPNGDFWLLEYSLTNEQRLRRR